MMELTDGRCPTDGRRPKRMPRECRTRYLWWPYVKNCIRAYPGRCRQMELSDTDSAGMESDINWGPPRPTERQALRRLRGQFRTGQWQREYDGVRLALADTEKLPDGERRISLIDMVFWKRTHTIQGAAMQCHVSERTAVQWHGDFIRLTEFHMGLLDGEKS